MKMGEKMKRTARNYKNIDAEAYRLGRI